jgi:pimeloyl-ACP methyl ester carboxylesterase
VRLYEVLPYCDRSVGSNSDARARVDAGNCSVWRGTGAAACLFAARADEYFLAGHGFAEELGKRGVYATVSNHSEWQSLADQAASNYKARKEDPIILIGHSLGADAVMQMAAYLNRKKIPVALVMPFDGTESFSTPSNVGRLVNLTQRKYAYLRPGPGFHGSLANVDVSGDPSIDHINIDKSPRLHARAISEVLAVIRANRIAGPNSSPPVSASPSSPPREEGAVRDAPVGGDVVKPRRITSPSLKSDDGATNSNDFVNPPSASTSSLRGGKAATRSKAVRPAGLPD